MAIPEEEVRRFERVTIAAGPTVPTVIEVGRVSWSGVWGGFFVGLGFLMLLAALGVAVGSTLTGPAATDAQALGRGAAIWTFASALIALFLGGMVASRLGPAATRGAGAIQGMLVWVMAFLAFVLVAGAGFSIGTRDFFGVTTMQTMAGDLSSLANGDADEIVTRLNDPRTVDLVATATGVPREAAATQLAAISQRVEAARHDPTRARAEARAGLEDLASRAAARAQPYARTTSWAVFAALAVTLIAALLGGTAGARRIVVPAPL